MKKLLAQKPRRTSSPEIEVSVTMTVPTRWAAPEVRAPRSMRQPLWLSRGGFGGLPSRSIRKDGDEAQSGVGKHVVAS